MSSEHVERRLAAILAADVAGSCRLIGSDEEGTLAQLKALRRTLFDPKIAAHHGRVVKNTGDGALVEFASVVDAVRCAAEIQRGMAEHNIDVPEVKRIEFRIGIHVGDIIIEDHDIFGDGVNIAARLEGIAEPGGVCMSDDAYRQVRGKVEVACDDMGQQSLKNIADPIRTWRVRLTGQTSSAAISGSALSQPRVLPLPDKPSIAVLPFQNMSGDPQQEYFADGIVEEIITALSRFKRLLVIARNSSFTYKGKAVDIKQVGRELGVRYVLEGSVRKAGGMVRIAGQLIEASTGTHLWADRFEGSLDDVFDLQDRVTASVVGAIIPKVNRAEIERARRKPTENLDAYDFHLRGAAKLFQSTNEALELFYKAIELDPDFALPYALAAMCYAYRRGRDRVVDREREIAETMRLVRRAVELGEDDANVLSSAGCALAFVAGELDEGMAYIDRSLGLNPNSANAWNMSGWVRIWYGQPEIAIDHIARAMRLSPLDPGMHWMETSTAHACFFAGRYDEAASWAAKALRGGEYIVSAWHMATVSNALAGRTEEAARACARLQQIDPALRISNLGRRLGPYRRPEDRARYEEGLRRAGLPD